MTTLAHKLQVTDYFALAFGVMVGTAWLVVMDDILARGGPLGAILGFTAGALILLPIGYVYSQLVPAVPDSGGETAYVAKFFSPWMAGCASYLHLKPRLFGRAAAIFGLLVTSLMIAVTILPVVPGHFTRYEWNALGIWVALGFVLRAATVQS